MGVTPATDCPESHVEGASEIPMRLVNITSPLGKDEIARRIEIEEQTQILLTSDKPVYQPGQTIHLRALALDMATRQAVAEQSVTFEVEACDDPY